MHLSVIMPAHNEAEHLAECLESFVNQTLVPNELIIVDDNSTDNTFQIASIYGKKYDWIKVLQRKSKDEHIPGKKVVDTFYFGLQHTKDYDLIGKFDADIVLPPNYFEAMLNHFQSNWKLGMCGGLLFVKKQGHWNYENIADKNHIRGPIKLYHKACLGKIGGLRPGVGWDTVDILLAKYHDFHTLVDGSLRVKHLRPTGQGYSGKKAQSKGEALDRMHYGIILSKIAALKMAWQAKSPVLYFQILLGYIKSAVRKAPKYVTREEGAFIRKHRWRGIRSKLS